MYGLQLQPNEAVILSQENVFTKSIGSMYSYNLYLTNHNIIIEKKGVTGKTKSADKYPLTMIKKFNNQAQVEVKKDLGSYPSLNIYFLNDSISVKSANWNMSVVKNWAVAIQAVVSGDETTIRNLDKNIQGSQWDGLFGAFGNFKESFKRNLGIKNDSVGEEKKAVSSTSGKCVGCSAPIAGKVGETVVCSYCGTEQVI